MFTEPEKYWGAVREALDSLAAAQKWLLPAASKSLALKGLAEAAATGSSVTPTMTSVITPRLMSTQCSTASSPARSSVVNQPAACTRFSATMG